MTAQLKNPSKLMTLDQFFAWDGGGHAGKLELIDGLVRAMSPASVTHSMIQGNILFAIKTHLRGSRCRASPEAPVVPPLNTAINARVPDVAVTCAPLTDSNVLEDPLLIVEVLSPSNEVETWGSIRSLAGLVSLTEILVVQSTFVEAEVYRRDAKGAWPTQTETTRAGGTIRLASIDLELPMADVYSDTMLAAAAATLI
jgi:Uma2 family endonuclease